jgi:hypothetical protein
MLAPYLGKEIMIQRRWHPLAPLTGLVFVVLIVAAFIVGGESPGIDDSAQKVVDYYQDNEGETFFASALLAWGAVFLVFFLGILRALLRDGDEARDRMSTVAFGGGLVLAAGLLSFAGFGFTLADGVDHLGPESMRTINALSSDFFFLVAGGGAVLLIASAITIIRTGALPVWLGWIALVLGIASATPAGFFAFLGFLVWTAIVSVFLWRASATPAAPPPAAPPPAV